MKIGIIGSGNMGRALGVRLAAVGHDVMFGARRPEQSQAAVERVSGGAQAGSNDEAAAFGEVLVWTMREPDPAAVLANPALLDGKVVIEINNRDYANEARAGVWFEKAIAERLQDNAPAARVVKAFNTIAMESFDTTPEALRESSAQTFVAGGDGDAKAAVAKLAGDLGFQAVDVGSGPAAFRGVEALGDVIRIIMIDAGRGGRAHLSLNTLPEPNLQSVGAREASTYR
ncbi:MAG: NADPH-dependent F420 reductase [Allosphingosinicella sp.]|uniref:NADPH-dependent F420 reductase n=1 Tax=Allosphingosinicella sp. TaxID=2823234 RepID=UPI00394E8561